MNINKFKNNSEDKYIIGENIYLIKTDYKTWSKTRNIRYSDETEKYDPYTPHKSAKQEKEFWNEFVETGLCLNFAIYTDDNQLIGFIQAFDFMKLNSGKKEAFKYYERGSECETGIWILDKNNFGKGYGYLSYKILLDYLQKEYNLKRTIIYTYLGNKNSLGLYKKLGYIDRDSEIYKFEGYEYKKFEYTL